MQTCFRVILCKSSHIYSKNHFLGSTNTDARKDGRQTKQQIFMVLSDQPIDLRLYCTNNKFDAAIHNNRFDDYIKPISMRQNLRLYNPGGSLENKIQVPLIFQNIL